MSMSLVVLEHFKKPLKFASHISEALGIVCEDICATDTWPMPRETAPDDSDSYVLYHSCYIELIAHMNDQKKDLS